MAEKYMVQYYAAGYRHLYLYSHVLKAKTEKIRLLKDNKVDYRGANIYKLTYNDNVEEPYIKIGLDCSLAWGEPKREHTIEEIID